MPRTRKPASPFRYFNSSPEIIRLVEMMYVRFPLSLRNVEDLLFEQGIELSYETVRSGGTGSGRYLQTACVLDEGFKHWQWHLDEMYVKIGGEMHYLWCAVEQEGEILESYVTKTRNKKAALAFIRKASKRHGSVETITTDGLRSYGAAMDELGNRNKQEDGRWANNRLEHSHLPFGSHLTKAEHRPFSSDETRRAAKPTRCKCLLQPTPRYTITSPQTVTSLIAKPTRPTVLPPW